MSVTIKDVARKAGVSTATVSLVIHDHQRISHETKRKVQEAIEALNYHPVRSARGLASQKSGNIGFIVTDDHFSRSEPFYTKIFLGTEFQARESEYYVLLTTVSTEFDDRKKLPRFVLEKNAEGIILAGKIPERLILELEKFNIPLVFIDYFCSPCRHPVVMIDNVGGGKMATGHLIECGHKKIAFIAGDLSHPSISERYQGYRLALEEAGIPFQVQNVISDQPYPARKFGYQAAAKIMRQNTGITAIFTCNDAMAIGVLQYLKENKIKVPEDISIIGFDDVEANLAMDPPLTTISVPMVDMGIEAMKLMTEVLQDKKVGARKVIMPVELIIRMSTCQVQKYENSMEIYP